MNRRADASQGERAKNTAASKKVFGDWRAEWAKAVVLAAVGGATALLTPLRDIISDWVWSQPPRLTLELAKDAVYVGDTVNVRVFLQSTTPAALPSGLLKLESTPELTLRGEKTFLVDRAASAAGGVFPSSGPGRLQATSAGKAKVKARFEIKDRQPIEETVTVTILPRDERVNVSKNDFTGRWTLQLGSSRGVIGIIDNEGNLVGRFTLGNRNGTVSGVRDGEKLILDLQMEDKPIRWSINETWKLSEGTILAQGFAVVQHPGKDEWKATDKKDSFIAFAKVAEE